MNRSFLAITIFILAMACRRPVPVIPTPISTPPLTALPTATSTPQPLVYTVAEGDSLWSIALQFETTVGAIAEANGLQEDEILNVGQKLVISNIENTQTTSTPTPSSGEGTVYIIAEWDTLGDVALKFEVTVGELAEANHLSDGDDLTIG